MKEIKIKICGVTSLDIAEQTAQAGTNYIGFVFDPKSKRFISPNKAKSIVQAINKYNITPVAVFKDQSAEEMLQVCETTKITTIQCHGNFSLEAQKKLPEHYHRIFVNSMPDNHNISRDLLLFDNDIPGSGKPSELRQIKPENLNLKFGIAGGLNQNNVLATIHTYQPNFVDVSSGVENPSGQKDIALIKQFIQAIKDTVDSNPPENTQTITGYYGNFGGMFIPELLTQPITELSQAFNKLKQDKLFLQEFSNLLRHYAGRPTPLTKIERFAKNINGPNIYIKREDLLHTGAHKLNNALGQCLLAKKMGKTRIIAETGAGQHGVATAAACAYLNLPCVVYMGAEDIKRQAPNVLRMKLMGAKIVSVTNGSATLKEAVNAALRDWSESFENTHYCLGSALGPHPFPEMVAYFQSVIGTECKQQSREIYHFDPDLVIACVGGGSNAIGIFSVYLNNINIKLIGVEAGGHGNQLGEHAARFKNLTKGVLHGCFTYVLQDNNGQIAPTSSISAGLDYPAVGPQHAQLFHDKRVDYVSVTDQQALHALKLLAQTEGIICALESAHALAYLIEIAHTLPKNYNVIVNLSGRGDKDLPQISNLTQTKSSEDVL